MWVCLECCFKGEAMVLEAACALVPGAQAWWDLAVRLLRSWYTEKVSVANFRALWALICLAAWEGLGLPWWLRH